MTKHNNKDQYGCDLDVQQWFDDVYSDDLRMIENNLFPEGLNVENREDGIDKLLTLRSIIVGLLRQMREKQFINWNEYEDLIKVKKYINNKINKLKEKI